MDLAIVILVVLLIAFGFWRLDRWLARELETLNTKKQSSRSVEPIRNKLPSGNVYRVEVDYRKPISEYIDEGRYELRNILMTNDNFPSAIDCYDKECVCSPVERLELYLVYIPRKKESACLEEVRAELDSMGMRPARIHELLALGNHYPELRKDFDIIAAGSLTRTSRGEYVAPVLARSGEGTVVSITFVDRLGLLPWQRFLAVPK